MMFADLSEEEKAEYDKNHKACEEQLETEFFGKKGSSDGYISRRELLLSELRGRLADTQNPFALIVGSGVTASVKLPKWSVLLGRLEINSFDLPSEDRPYCLPFHTADEFIAAEDYFNISDPLELAEYIKLSFPEGVGPWREEEKHSLMKTAVRKALEADCSYQDTSKNSNTYLYHTVHLINKQFRESNRHVVTFNYDNLLEYYYNQSFPGDKASPVYEAVSPLPGQMNIYHIHGFLGLKDTEHAGEESKQIILTEDDYRELEQYPYCWENYLLTRALHEGDSLFLGFSGDDYNFRRILRGFRELNGDKKRYLVVSIGSIIRSSVKMAFAERKKEMDYMVFILRRWLQIQEKYWTQKGFTPIWVTRKECPELIGNLYQDHE